MGSNIWFKKSHSDLEMQMPRPVLCDSGVLRKAEPGTSYLSHGIFADIIIKQIWEFPPK